MPIFFLPFSTLLSPYLGLLLAGIDFCSGRKYWRIDICIFAFFIAHFSYCYTPENVGPDLVRYFSYLDELKHLRFIDVLNYQYKGTNLFSFNFLVWICNLFGDQHLLPFFTSFSVYYIFFYCSYIIARDNGLTRRELLLFLLVASLCLDWYGITNNIRNVFAFSLVGFAAFEDLYLKNRGIPVILLYLLPIFIHPTAVLIVLIRLIVGFIKTNSMRLLLLLLTIMVNPAVSFLHLHIGSITSNQLITFVINKAYNYLFDYSSAYGIRTANSIRSLLARIAYLILVAIIIFIAFRIDEYRFATNPIYTNNLFSFESFVVSIGLLALSCTFMLRPEYWRFAAVMIVFSSSILSPYLLRVRKKKKGVMYYLLLVVALTCIVINWYQISWINSNQLLIDSITKIPLVNIFIDLANFLRGY